MSPRLPRTETSDRLSRIWPQAGGTRKDYPALAAIYQRFFLFLAGMCELGVSLHRPCFLHYSHISHCSRSVAGRQSVPVHPRKDRGMKSSQACPEWCHRQYLVPVTLHMLAASCPSRAIRPGDEILRLNGCPNTFCNALEKPHRRGAATRPTTLRRGSGAGFADQTLVAELVTARTP